MHNSPSKAKVKNEIYDIDGFDAALISDKCEISIVLLNNLDLVTGIARDRVNDGLVLL